MTPDELAELRRRLAEDPGSLSANELIALSTINKADEVAATLRRLRRGPQGARSIEVHGVTVDIIERIADTIQNDPDADASSLVMVLNLRGLVGAWDAAAPVPPATS